MKTVAIWNHDMVADRTVITSGGNVTVIGPGAMVELPEKLAAEVLAEAQRSGAPFNTTAAPGVVVGGQVFVKSPESGVLSPESGVLSPESRTKALVVPVGIFDEVNLGRLDRDLLLRMAACLGQVLDEGTTKKAVVKTILDLAGVNVPPTETGENQPIPASTEKE